MANTALHSGVGVKILAWQPNLFGLVFAFLSHLLVDFFPESYLPPKKWYIAGEVILGLASIVSVFYFAVNPWWLFWGAISANLMDIIDYPLYKYKGYRIFPCHPKPRKIDWIVDFQTWGMSQKANLIIDYILVAALLVWALL